MALLTIEGRLAVTEAIHRFFAAVDAGRASETCETFTDDVTITFAPGLPQPGTIAGRAVRDAMIAREALTSAFTRHVISNIILEEGDDGVSAGYIMTLYRSDDGTRSTVPAFVGNVDETWRREAGGWRLAARTLRPAFARGS